MTHVLAIGIDAAEPAVVRRAIDAGELPALAKLLRGGTWRHVDSPANIGSGAVWPTFFTGTDPAEHGVYSFFRWDPRAMRIGAYDGHGLIPFWDGLARNGTTVGVLDVPFAPVVGLTQGFEISEWGPHDLVNCRLHVSPADVHDLVTKTVGPHPYTAGHDHVAGVDDHGELAAIAGDALEGARQRGELAERLIVHTHPAAAIVVFTEVHHAGHHLMHTVEPEHPAYDAVVRRSAAAVHPNLLDVYREVDRQIGRLVDAVPRDATIIVFSLHGMRPTREYAAAITEPLLTDLGLEHCLGWREQSWPERTRSLLSVVKQRMPQPVRKLYHKSIPRSVRHRVAIPTVMPPHDWSRTRAFSLPADQHGWVRINLVGRESLGIVRPEDYESTCTLVEDALRAATTDDGQLLVRDVLRPAQGAAASLPDLVVHWNGDALGRPVRIRNRFIRTVATGPRLTGEHGLEGFCIVSGPRLADAHEPAPIAVKDLHRLIVGSLPAVAGSDASRSAI